MLLLISVLTLIVSGVGIMNIMLATVNARTREIGVRKAVGATNAEIRAQFLLEAMLISLAGGIVGIFIGLALPFSVRFITNYRVPISGWSVIIAVVVSTLVGVSVWNRAGRAGGRLRSDRKPAIRVGHVRTSVINNSADPASKRWAYEYAYPAGTVVIACVIAMLRQRPLGGRLPRECTPNQQSLAAKNQNADRDGRRKFH